MTAALPALGPVLKPAAEPTAKAAKPEAFALPDREGAPNPVETPDPTTTEQTAPDTGTGIETETGAETETPIIAAPATPLPAASVLLPIAPAIAPPGDAAAQAAPEATREPTQLVPEAANQPQRLSATIPAEPGKAAQKPAATDDEQNATGAPIIAKASTSPTPSRPSPAQLPPQAATAGGTAESSGQSLAQFHGQSSGQSLGQGQHNAPRAGAQTPVSTEFATASAPFRIDLANISAQLSPASADAQPATPASFSASSTIANTPDLGSQASVGTPDVVVGLVDGGALDVTIAAADVGSLERLTAAEPELRHELAALGAEVEAIRVELRAEQGADKGPERGAAGNNLSQSGEDGGRQGDRMMRQNDSGEKDWGQKDWGDGQGRQRVEARRQRASLGSEAPGLSARLSGAGRIDRYA